MDEPLFLLPSDEGFEQLSELDQVSIRLFLCEEIIRRYDRSWLCRLHVLIDSKLRFMKRLLNEGET